MTIHPHLNPLPQQQAMFPGHVARDCLRSGHAWRMPRTVLAGLVLGMLLIAGGCSSQFAGEWVQDGTYSRDGIYTPATAERRMALKFEPPATVRYGFFHQATGVVDPDSIQSYDYQTLNGRSVAEFGELVARVEGDHLLVDGLKEGTLRMTKMKGKQVFPSNLHAPQLTRAQPSPGAAPAIVPVEAVALRLNVDPDSP